MTHFSLAIAGALALATPARSIAAQEAGAAGVAVELLDGRALLLALERLASEQPELVRFFEIGTSRSGRAIGALRICAGEEAPGRPAILVVANLEGPDVSTSGLALHHARALAEGYGKDERATALLDRTTVYVVPRANPDAAEARFETPLLERVATGAGVDNDRDGRAGEDDRSDANGDGYVTSMRFLDPEGEWIEDPTEPRVLIRAKREKGERGRWKLVPEGRDADGDEEVAEDPVHDAVVNRNFAWGWKEHAPEAGIYPSSEPEARALADFVLAHRDIALVLIYGAQMNLAGKLDEAPSGGKRGDQPAGYAKEDLELLEELGRRYRETTKNETEAVKEEAGSFQAWCHHHRGLWTLNVDPWSVPVKSDEKKKPEDASDPSEVRDEEAAAEETLSTGETEPDPEEEATGVPPLEGAEHSESTEAKELSSLEALGVAQAFLPWTAFDHPELGAVEVGGFAPYVRIEPPPSVLAELAQPHFDFLLGLGDALARVRLVDVEARRLGEGLYEVEAALENAALLPLRAQSAIGARSVRPARVQIELGADATLLGGAAQELVGELAGAGGRRELRWLVQTADPTAIRILVDTDHAGTAAVQPEVQ